MIKIKYKEVKSSLIILIILFLTDSALVTTNINRIWARMSWMIIIGLMIYLLVGKSWINIKAAWPALLLCVCILFSMLTHNGNQAINYIQRAVLVFTTFLFAERVNYEWFMKYFIKVMKVLAVISIIGVLLKPVVVAVGFIPNLWTSETSYYKSLLLTNVSTHYALNRNYGIFSEPGVYQLYLNWALFYEFRHKDKFRFFDVLLFSLTILTTYSTAGIPIMALEYVFFVLSGKNGERIRNDIKKTGKRFLKYKLLIIAVGITALALFLGTSLRELVMFKIREFFATPTEVNSGNVSTYTRVHSITASVYMIRSNPLFGVGIAEAKNVLDQFSITSNTNTILGTGAMYGLVALLIYLLMIVRCVLGGARDFLTRLLFFVVIIMMYSTEPLNVSFFFTFVLFLEARHGRADFCQKENKLQGEIDNGQNTKCLV